MNSIRFYPYFLFVLAALLAYGCSRDYPATAPYTPLPQPTNPGTGQPTDKTPVTAPKRLFLSNEKVKVAIDLNMGGVINYLSEAGSTENMINNYDLGRQTGTALYTRPIPYSQNGKQPPEAWKGLGWNPVMSGDYYNHPARIVSYQQSQNQLYVKTIPLIWPLFDEPAECVMEQWVEIQDNTVHVRNRITVNRADTTQYEAQTQETPLIYLNAPWYRLVSYVGSQPFTNAPADENTNVDATFRYGTENWVAILNAQGRGLGLYKPNEYRFQTNGFVGARAGNESDIQASYMNSNGFLIIDHNGQYEYEYTLVLGTLTDIRQFAYSQPRPIALPNYRFTQDRLGWYYYNAIDRGWPIQNELNIRFERVDTTKTNFRICSPMVFWRTADLPKIYIQAAFTTKATVARLVWRKPEDVDFYDIPERYVEFPIVGDGQFRTYEITLKGQTGWDGVAQQIGIYTPPSQQRFEKGSTLRLRSVTADKP